MEEFKLCEKCEFFNGYAHCKVDNLRLYSEEGVKRNIHCEYFLLKGTYQDQSDIECILKEKRKGIKNERNNF